MGCIQASTRAKNREDYADLEFGGSEGEPGHDIFSHNDLAPAYGQQHNPWWRWQEQGKLLDLP